MRYTVAMYVFPKAVTRMIEALALLPGVGQRSATRMALHLVRQPEYVSEALGSAALQLKKEVRYCTRCRALTDTEVCSICVDSERDGTVLCVVEEALDISALENAGGYRGRYHVLHGVLNPLEGIGPEQLTIPQLLRRVEEEKPMELVLAMNPSLEGEATALYIARMLAESGVRMTRLARGLPTGSELSFSDAATLSAALVHRREFGVR